MNPIAAGIIVGWLIVGVIVIKSIANRHKPPKTGGY
jgi:hypothetical protein